MTEYNDEDYKDEDKKEDKIEKNLQSPKSQSSSPSRLMKKKTLSKWL